MRETCWLLSLVDIVDTLSNIPRVGWCQRDVSKELAEDIAKHTLLVSYMGLILCKLYQEYCGNVNCEKVLTMCLIHDVPEAGIGNIAGHVRKLIPNFRNIEIKQLEELLSTFPEKVKSSIGTTFIEYREQMSIESTLTVLADKLATLIRAVKYFVEGKRKMRDLVQYYSEEVKKVLEKIPCEQFKSMIEESLRYVLDFVH